MTTLPGLQYLVQTLEDALSEFLEFLDLSSVLSSDEIACSDKLHEHAHVVPCEDEHQREGKKIA